MLENLRTHTDNAASTLRLPSANRTRLRISLLVVEVVCLGRGEEWEVVAAVRVAGRHERETEPEPGSRDVRAKQQRAECGRNQVADHVFDRVCVHGSNPDRRRPLVVHLVNVFVQEAVMKQPTRKHSYTTFVWESNA